MPGAVHIVRHGGTSMVLDVESGSVHLLDAAALFVLQRLLEAGGDPDRLAGTLDTGQQEALEEIQALRGAGTLLSPVPAVAPALPAPGGLKALCLNVAHDCNLYCRYCFASRGDFGGDRGCMDPETGCRAVDYLVDHSGPRRLLEIDFFGGEPLLAWDTVCAVLRHARRRGEETGKRFKFSLTTNGVRLDPERIRHLVEEDVGLVLSLDGRPEVNDRMRPFPDGSPSSGRVVPAFQEVARRTGDYVIRGTYTRANLDFVQDVRYLLSQGFGHLSLEPVVAPPDAEYALQPGDLERLRQEYWDLAALWLARRDTGEPLDFFHFNVDLAGGPCLPKRIRACGAGFEYLAVSPDGSLYPCHQFVGRREYRMGTLSGGIGDPGLAERFRGANVYGKPACRECWARYLCSGGCHASASQGGGPIETPDPLGCEIQKIRLEVAIFLQGMVLLRGEIPRTGPPDLTDQADRSDRMAQRKIRSLLFCNTDDKEAT